MTAAPLTILIETPDGPVLRPILAESPLRDDLQSGEAAEVAAQDAAALWGMPDFVYRAELLHSGGSSREIGDRLLLVGDLGVVVQVKARAAATAEPGKEAAWLMKQTATALRQANGTIRTLERSPIRVTNARGRRFEISGAEREWIAAVVIDHPEPPRGFTPSLAASKHPAVVLARRDWEFLFRQLKSTHAVCGYLKRVAGEEHELGLEPARYFELALADEQAEPAPLAAALIAGGHQLSSPLLPLHEAASDDFRANLLIRSIFEDIAIAPSDRPDEEGRVRILAELDRLPVSDRSMIGQYLTDGIRTMGDGRPDVTDWRLRRVVGPLESTRTAHLCFGTCSQGTDEHRQVFASWVQLRHHQLQQVIEDADRLTTIGILLTPRDDGRRAFDTTMFAVSGDLGLTAEEVAAYERIWSYEDEKTLGS